MGGKEFNQLAVSYDKDADVLYMSEGEPQEAICQMLDDGVVVRRNPKTKEVIGFTIVDFISNFSIGRKTAMKLPKPVKGYLVEKPVGGYYQGFYVCPFYFNKEIALLVAKHLGYKVVHVKIVPIRKRKK